MISARWYLTLPPGAPTRDSAEFLDREAKLCKEMRAANGSLKTTARHRLSVVSQLFFDIVARRNLRPRTIVDIGVSSGITTLDWLDDFERHGLDVRMTATDLTINVYFVKILPFLAILVDSNGHVLQIELFRRGIRPWTAGRREYVSGAVAFKKALLGVCRFRLKQLDVRFPIHGVHGSAPSVIEGPYRFVTPELRNRADVILREEDISQAQVAAVPWAADAIRLSNILLLVYFSPEQVCQIVKRVVARCRGENSLVILCRNMPDGSIHASILRMVASGKFEVEARLGPGSEVESYFTQS